MFALTSSHLDDFFRYDYLYTVMITIFLVEKLGIVGGWGGGSFYPSNILDRTLANRSSNNWVLSSLNTVFLLAGTSPYRPL